MRRSAPPRGALPVLVATLLATAAPPAAGQVFEGRVLDEEDERPIVDALVRLVDLEERLRGAAVSDSAGRYRLEAPGPGEYRLVAERIGYQTFESLPLAVSDPERVYPVDVGLRTAPVPLPGIVVTADRLAELDRAIHLAAGLDPASLRTRPILRPELESHVRRGHTVIDLMRWSNVAGMVVKDGPGGPCFQVRRRDCLPVFLNDWRVPGTIIDVVPLDMVEAVVVIMPKESVRYDTGAILLYTVGWLR